MERLNLFKRFLDEKHETTVVHQHYLNTMREYAPNTNLYMREIHFLTAIDPGTSVSVSELAEKMEVTLGAASQMASKLEIKGFLYRTPDPADKRRTMVSLTEAGERMYAEHLEYDRDSLKRIERMFQDYSDEEMERIIEAERIFRMALKSRLVE